MQLPRQHYVLAYQPQHEHAAETLEAKAADTPHVTQQSSSNQLEINAVAAPALVR
jgi:hypothetical protein